MRITYLITGIIIAALVIFNAPRLPWIPHEEGGPIGILRGFSHGMIGFSWEATWLLLIGGAYMIILGIVYWDMDVSEAQRWQFSLETGGTAKLLWIAGSVCLALGLLYAYFCVRNDNYLWPCGVMSSIVAILSTWLFWLAFPLMEQVGIDREDFGI
jgi:hypothetical protein